MVAERRVERRRSRRATSTGKSPWLRATRRTRRAVAFREQEPVVARRGRPVVRAPRGRRAVRERAPVVLLVAGRAASGAPAGRRSRTLVLWWSPCIQRRTSTIVQVKCQGIDHRRALRSQRRLAVRAPLLRAPGADRGAPHRRQPAPLPERHAAAASRLIQAGKAAGIPLERIRRGPRHAARRQDAARSATGSGSVAGGGGELDERIATLEAIRGRLTGCIGCGCLSLRTCALLDPEDEAASLVRASRKSGTPSNTIRCRLVVGQVHRPGPVARAVDRADRRVASDRLPRAGARDGPLARHDDDLRRREREVGAAEERRPRGAKVVARPGEEAVVIAVAGRDRAGAGTALARWRRVARLPRRREAVGGRARGHRRGRGPDERGGDRRGGEDGADHGASSPTVTVSTPGG